MYALLFFLPIYYRIIKGHSAINTGLLLLSQTLMLAPCGAMVFGLIEKLGFQVHWMIVVGWLCTSCGFGLLTMLNAEKSVAVDILLNLLSGFGIGILLPALAVSAKDSADSIRSRQTTMILVYMRYLGSATGLVVMGLLFQRVLRRNLASTLHQEKAEKLVKHATTLVYSIQAMPRSDLKTVLIQATQSTLCTIWTVLSIASAIIFILSCAKVLIMANEERAKTSSPPVIRSLVVLNPSVQAQIREDDPPWNEVFAMRNSKGEKDEKEF